MKIGKYIKVEHYSYGPVGCNTIGHITYKFHPFVTSKININLLNNVFPGEMFMSIMITIIVDLRYSQLRLISGMQP